MNHPFRPSRAGALAVALAAALIGASRAFAAAPAIVPAIVPAQEAGNGIFDNFLFLVVGGVLLALAASVVGGAVIAVLASIGSRFFRRNLPTDEEMSQLKVEYDKTGAKRRLPRLGPTAEPLVISLVGFIVFFFISSTALGLMAKPVPGVNAAAGEAFTTPAPSAALPTEGDLAEIVAGLPPGDPANGEKLFTAEGCVGCHSQAEGQRMVGPTFYNLWQTAATREEGLGPKEYLYHSIVAPNDYVVESYQPGLMPQNYATLLSPQDMADILAWIETAHNNEP